MVSISKSVSLSHEKKQCKTEIISSLNKTQTSKDQKMRHCKLRNAENIAKYLILSKQNVSRFLDIKKVTPS